MGPDLLKAITKIDGRLVWGLRFILYKFFLGELKGIGYIGPSTFSKGLRNLYVGPGLGLFPGWRIEILKGMVRIGKNLRAGQNLFINCGSEIRIGDNVTISANVFIGTSHHITTYGDLRSFSEWEIEERPIVIGDNCFIGYGAAILPGSILETGCIIGANSVIKGHFKAGAIVAPAKTKTIKYRI